MNGGGEGNYLPLLFCKCIQIVIEFVINMIVVRLVEQITSFQTKNAFQVRSVKQ